MSGARILLDGPDGFVIHRAECISCCGTGVVFSGEMNCDRPGCEAGLVVPKNCDCERCTDERAAVGEAQS